MGYSGNFREFADRAAALEEFSCRCDRKAREVEAGR
jgi:hypothetical protein